MKLLKRLVIGLLAIAVLLAVIGIFLPSRVHVERTTWIDAPPANVFTLLNGFGRFNDWSPWAELDPRAQYRYEGPATGVGAAMHWAGDDQVGSGSQTIVESRPFEYIETALDFGPMGTAEASYTLAPENDGTRVTWAMDTDFGWDLMGRYMGLFFDRWVGHDYEKGLANLKALAESLPKADLAGAEIEVMEVEPIPIAYVSGESTHEDEVIEAAFTEAFARIGTYLAQNGLVNNGAPLAIAHHWEDNRYVFDAALPYSGTAPEPEAPEETPGQAETEAGQAQESEGGSKDYRLEDGVELGETYGGRAVRAVHTGPYSDLARTWNRLEAFIAARGLNTAGDPWEAYISDPGDTPEEELITHIYWPVE